ncbi:MAG: hypothetical protein AB1393_05950 [Candidatus Edwardsbacteria bacterium]
MIQVTVECPHCRKSLMDEKVKIDGHPSIKVMIEYMKERGTLYLSSLYGSYNIQSELLVPEGKIAHFFCPYCKAYLETTRICEKCEAPMVAMKFPRGGIIQICSRRGCKKHLVEFEDLETEIREFYEAYSTFVK